MTRKTTQISSIYTWEIAAVKALVRAGIPYDEAAARVAELVELADSGPIETKVDTKPGLETKVASP